MALANITPGDLSGTPASALMRWGTEALAAQKTAVSVPYAMGGQEHDQQHEQPDPDTPASEPGFLVADAGAGTVSDVGGRPGDEATLIAMGCVRKGEDAIGSTPDNQASVAAGVEQYTQPYADLKFSKELSDQFERFNPGGKAEDPVFLKYGVHPEMTPEMVNYHAKISKTTLDQGETKILKALGVDKDTQGVDKLTGLLKNKNLSMEKRIQLKNQLALLVLGEDAYGEYARSMAVLANDQSTVSATKLARQTISSLGLAKYHFSQEFIAQQEAMAATWSANLSNEKAKERLAPLARKVREFGNEKEWTDAKRAAIEEFLKAACEQAGMPKDIKITIGSPDNSAASAATRYDGNIIFNKNNKLLSAGNVDGLMTVLFHEAGHAWNYVERKNGTPDSKKVSERDLRALSRPAFQDSWVDQSLYESNPDEVHSRLIQGFAKAANGMSFSECWGLPKEAKI